MNFQVNFVVCFQQLRQEVMDACVALRSLCECIRARRRRASMSLSSLSSSNGAADTSATATATAADPLQEIRLDGKFEVLSQRCHFNLSN